MPNLGVLAVAAVVALVVVFPPAILAPVIATAVAALTSPSALSIDRVLVLTMGYAVILAIVFSRLVNQLSGKKSKMRPISPVLVKLINLVVIFLARHLTKVRQSAEFQSLAKDIKFAKDRKQDELDDDSDLTKNK